MGFISAYEGTRRVPVGDASRGYWAELREYVTEEARETATKALTRAYLVNSQLEVNPDMIAYRRHMVLASLVDWNLDEEDGTIWPLTLESVKRLPGQVLDELFSVVDTMNAEPTVTERQRFHDAGERSGDDGVGSTTELGDLLDGAGVLAPAGAETRGPGETPLA